MWELSAAGEKIEWSLFPFSIHSVKDAVKRELERMLGKALSRRFWLYSNDLREVKPEPT